MVTVGLVQLEDMWVSDIWLSIWPKAWDYGRIDIRTNPDLHKTVFLSSAEVEKGRKSGQSTNH